MVGWDGQVEKHFSDGSKEILFPDFTKRVIAAPEGTNKVRGARAKQAGSRSSTLLWYQHLDALSKVYVCLG